MFLLRRSADGDSRVPCVGASWLGSRRSQCLLLPAAVLVIVAASVCGGCGRVGAQRPLPEPAVTAKPRPRIVSLAPNFTETLFGLGLGDCVVGRTEFCLYPEEALNVESVGPYGKPNFERLLALAPDLVIAESTQIEGHKAMLDKAGIRVAVIDCKRVDLIPPMITQMGQATGVDERADALVREWMARRDAVATKTADLPAAARPTVMVDLWEDPLMVAGPGSFVDELIQLAGGRNVAFDATKNWATFSVEAVVNRKLDVIVRAFMGSDAENEAAKLLDWNAMPGLEQMRLYGADDINPDLLLQPGLRTVDALEKLGAILHPELFPPFVLPEAS